MYAGVIILSDNANLSKAQIERRMEKYCFSREIEWYEYGTVDEFRKRYEEEIPDLERYIKIKAQIEENKEEEKDPWWYDFCCSKVEALEGIEKYILSFGVYKVDGDKVFCNRNYKEGKLDWVAFHKPYFFLEKKDGNKNRKRCRVEDWTLKSEDNYYYSMLYDWDRDTWHGKIWFDEEAQKEWNRNYPELISNIGNKYAYSIAIHA